MRLTFYEKPGCVSNTKQKALLRSQGFALEVRDLLSEPWTAERLRVFFGERPVVEWFNPTAPSVKQGAVDPAALSETQALAAMLEEPLLIRRPLIECAAGSLCGFEPHPLFEHIGVRLDAAQDLQACSKTGEADPVCLDPKAVQ